MSFDRRCFLTSSLTVLASVSKPQAAANEAKSGADPGGVGCLIDTTLCIGCRQCEDACNRRNSLPRPVTPFRSKEVFSTVRRPTSAAFTVVNAYADPPSADQPRRRETFVKKQCMHCIDPACVSACIVGALSTAEDGAVVYNSDICIGCRYCLIACPFQIPAYEYHEPVSPRVRKCEFCTDLSAGFGANPACAAACPTEALTFGSRIRLLEMAHARIRQRPERYEDSVYGEFEVGGTRWLYLFGRPASELGLPSLPEAAPPRLIESIQHGIFRYAAVPIALYTLLGCVMLRNRRRRGIQEPASDAGTKPAVHIE